MDNSFGNVFAKLHRIKLVTQRKQLVATDASELSSGQIGKGNGKLMHQEQTALLSRPDGPFRFQIIGNLNATKAKDRRAINVLVTLARQIRRGLEDA